MTEIELKFQVPHERRETVRAAVAGRGASAMPLRLQAAYFDTDDGLLAGAGVALRLRREGPRWVQTLKATGADAMTRLEHNAPRRERGAAVPALDLALHTGTPAGDRLAALLASRPDATLVCRYRTDIRRTARLLRRHGATLELAFDEGVIVAGEAAVAVCELEIELVAGSPAGLLAVAGEWVARHGLWLDTRSKAERGTMLAQGRAHSPPRKAVDVRLDRAADAASARRIVLAECLQQVTANASTVASGDFAEEHVHQLRVGWRRLRTALQLFAADAQGDAMEAAAADAFRALSAARDAAAIAGPLGGSDRRRDVGQRAAARAAAPATRRPRRPGARRARRCDPAPAARSDGRCAAADSAAARFAGGRSGDGAGARPLASRAAPRGQALRIARRCRAPSAPQARQAPALRRGVRARPVRPQGHGPLPARPGGLATGARRAQRCGRGPRGLAEHPRARSIDGLRARLALGAPGGPGRRLRAGAGGLRRREEALAALSGNGLRDGSAAAPRPVSARRRLRRVARRSRHAASATVAAR
ncbi:inorganic triphosphatase [Piscinibacter aquaticus]|uniref:Inorganic triphosphatase n=1 Tax=Piscinibacter aquaticus TaxID=392597 RepID=A0A5C6TY85_9BURK|nr:inorganic triphosphatase [Piscinibacter aquaticus]